MEGGVWVVKWRAADVGMVDLFVKNPLMSCAMKVRSFVLTQST
jgi:hypothetical protein